MQETGDKRRFDCLPVALQRSIEQEPTVAQQVPDLVERRGRRERDHPAARGAHPRQALFRWNRRLQYEWGTRA
jgi:hypothetical protein